METPLAAMSMKNLDQKNNQGGFASLNMDNKVVRQYETDLPRCHVKILDKYFSILPEDAASNDVFYLKPLPKPPRDPNAPWFTLTPIGKNKLGDMIRHA